MTEPSSSQSPILPSTYSNLQSSASKPITILPGDVPFQVLPVSSSFSSSSSSSSSSPSTSLAISPKGALLYSASERGIAVYDLLSLTQVDAFHPNAAGAVKALAFSSDGSHVFTAHQDTKIRVWRSESTGRRHSLLVSLPTGGDILRRFALPRNYVPVRRHRKRLWIEHVDAVTGLAVHGGLLFSVSWDKTLKIWRAADFRCVQSVSAHEDAINAVAVAGDGTVYTGSSDCRIRVWRKPPTPGKTYTHVATLEKHKSAINALVLSSDGRVLCSGANDKTILVWEEMELAAAIVGHQKAVMCLAYAEALLVSGSTDRTVRVWKRNAGGEFICLSVLAGHVGGVRTVAACRVLGAESESVEEYRVLSGSSDGEVRVWQVKLGTSSLGSI